MTFPIHEYLVPPPTYDVSPGFARVDAKLTTGLPFRIALDGDVSLTVLLANGLANTWRDADPEAAVDRSAQQRQPLADPAEDVGGPDLSNVPAFIVVRRSQSVRAAVPLVLGIEAIVPLRDSDATELLELRVLDWNIFAGNMRGAGDYGGNVAIEWRRAEKAVEHFSTPPVNPYLKPRLEPIYRMISTLGLRQPRIMTRFTARQAALKLTVLK